jgi:hypothetical protein
MRAALDAPMLGSDLLARSRVLAGRYVPEGAGTDHRRPVSAASS